MQNAHGRYYPRIYRGSIMGKVTPFHSKLDTDRKVYHDNDKCTEGNNIEKRNKVSGTGGRPLCKRCGDLA